MRNQNLGTTSLSSGNLASHPGGQTSGSGMFGAPGRGWGKHGHWSPETYFYNLSESWFFFFIA